MKKIFFVLFLLEVSGALGVHAEAAYSGARAAVPSLIPQGAIRDLDTLSYGQPGAFLSSSMAYLGSIDPNFFYGLVGLAGVGLVLSVYKYATSSHFERDVEFNYDVELVGGPKGHSKSCTQLSHQPE